MVSYNIMKLSFRNFSGHAHQMIESFIILCSARCLHRWKSIIDLHSNQTCIDHSIFGRTRMYVESFDHEIRFACVEVLILDLAFGITVQCIAVVSTELFYVEVRSTGTNLFIRCKCYAQRSVRNLFFLNAFDHCHDLCDSGFVISSENSRAVRSDQCTSFQTCQMREVLRT